MARVTVEDCVLKVPNRFELVLLAAQRARQITSGAPLTLDRDDDKNPVVALREIADETVGLVSLRDAVVRGMQKQVEIDEPEETQELEVDPIVFGVTPLAAVAEEEDAVLDEQEIGGDEVDVEDEETLDEELAEDILDGEDEVDLGGTPDGEPPDDFDETPVGEPADDFDEEA